MKNVKFRHEMLKNEYLDEVKKLNNKKLGVTVKSMPAKMYGCFQKNLSRVTIEFSESCIGVFCNGTAYIDNYRKCMKVIEPFNFERL